MKRYAIHSNKTVLSSGIHEVTILIEDGVIVMVVDGIAKGLDYPIEDAGDLVLMPGLVDCHVHINEPGRTEWEGFDTATKAAAVGGITTLIEMPLNSNPVTTTAAAFEEKKKATRGKLHVNCGFWGGVVPDNISDLEELIESGVFGIKAFLIDSGINDFKNVTEADLRAAMPIIAQHGVPLLVHSELETDISPPSEGDVHPADRGVFQNYQKYLESRPKSWENNAIDLMINLCREFNCRTHIVHLSSAESIEQIKIAKKEGLPLTVETCPHYLYFNAESIADGDTRFKCAPPIRENENNDLLWEAVKEGIIDFIVTDHSPAPPELKCLDTGDFDKAWGGIAGLQFSLPAFWTKAKERGFSIEDVVRLMSENTAAFAGLGSRKGQIAPGYDADLIVWNPNEEFTVTSNSIQHRHKITPYEDEVLRGVVKQTYVKGEKVYDEGEFVSLGKGELLLNTK